MNRNQDYSKVEYNINDYVQIKDSYTYGDIIELEKEKGYATIDTGSLRIRAKIKNLLPAKKQKIKTTEQIFTTTATIDSTSIDIRGRKPEEIEFEIIKYIDDAYLSGLKNIEIIHGKGKGVLRETVHQLLKVHEMVSSFALTSVEQGGAGATNIKLK